MLYKKVYSIILNPISKIISKINIKVRNLVVTIFCFCLIGYFIVYFNPIFYIRFKLTFDHLLCSGFLFVITIFSLKNDLKRTNWNRLVFYLFFFSGFGIMAISFLHPIGSGYRAFALMMMIGFPCFYFVWNNRGDYDELFKRLSFATSVVGIAYYCYCFYLSSKGLLNVVTGRVCASFADSNMFSMLGMVMVCCALYMLLVNRHSWKWFILTAISFGAGISIVKMGVSRLSIIVILGSMLAFSIYYLKIQSSIIGANKPAHKIIRAEILLAFTIVFILIGNLMLTVNAKVIAESVVSVPENAASSEQTDVNTAEEVSEDAVAPEGASSATDRFSIKGMDLDAYTAGRYHIWKGYAQFLNLTGNDFSKSDWYLLTMGAVKHAHNNFLEIAYRCGVPVACLHILLELVAGIICLIWLFNRKYKEPTYFFSISFMVCYAVQSLFDIATLPFERPAPFFFYMAMIPIFMYGSDKKEATQKKYDNKH